MINSKVSFREAIKFWLKLGFISFGGPAGQISLMHTELVDRKKWISENQFLHALNYCMMLPGPEAQQLATYMGWLLHGTKGGIIAGTLFIMPSLLLMIILSWVYVSYGEVKAISGILYGFKPAVVAIVAYAVILIGQKTLKNWFAVSLAVFAFCSLYFFKIPFPLIIILAGFMGWAASRFLKYEEFSAKENVVFESHTKPSPKKMIVHLLIGLALWAAPILILTALYSWHGTFTQIGWFFTKVALVTFGGAYAVLPYVSQNVIDNYGWLKPEQMIDGLALGETLPGPLIKIVAFVGFLGALQVTEFGITGAIFGAVVATYFTFLPSFLFILIGAPFIEASRVIKWFSSALTGITAAVVGVIFNLAVFFGSYVFMPKSGELDLIAILLSAVSFIGMWRLKWNIIYVVFGAGLFGMFYKLIII